ncbi:MAG: hypothetical protein CNLJKLNK_00770 [Holosporales bacterium]
MKKNTRIKTQSTLAILALSLVALNAAEQNATQAERLSSHQEAVGAPIRLTKEEVVNKLSQGVSDSDKIYIVKAVGKVDPDRYTEAFINTVNALTQGMDVDAKTCAIKEVGEVDPDRYTETFINTVNALSQGMKTYNRAYIINAVGNVNPDRYTESFINIVNALSQGEDAFNKMYVILAVGNVNPDRYTDFINTVNVLSEGMNASNKRNVIIAIGNVNPDRYTDFINTVNVFSEGMDASDKAYVIVALGKVNPDLYTELFINTVNALSQGVDAVYKRNVIIAIGKVNPDRYTDFVNTVNALSQGMDAWCKWYVIEALGEVNPDRYTDFINIINALSQGMDGHDKRYVIDAVGKVNPDRYTDFINTINALSQGMDGRNKWFIIGAVGKVNPDHYPFLQNFIRQNPRYFTYAPASQFSYSTTHKMTQKQLQSLLESLHREYYNDAPAGTPQALAFEIHNFANQTVVGETGEKQSFNGAVLNHLQRSIQGNVLPYDVVLDLLRSELSTLMEDKKTSNAINEEVYNWVIEINKDPQDKNAIATVVTYLEQKDNTHGKLATWLYAFMDESKNAYDGQNRESCIKGVKERVITSLRSAIPEGDTTLENLFHQAEAPFMLTAKSKRLTDYPFWAQKLMAKGVTSNTPEADAKIKFSEALRDYFEGIMDERVKATIDATLDSFDDSESDSDDASLRLAAPEDGIWSKIKAALLKIERGVAQPATR